MICEYVVPSHVIRDLIIEKQMYRGIDPLFKIRLGFDGRILFFWHLLALYFGSIGASDLHIGTSKSKQILEHSSLY